LIFAVYSDVSKLTQVDKLCAILRNLVHCERKVENFFPGVKRRSRHTYHSVKVKKVKLSASKNNRTRPMQSK